MKEQVKLVSFEAEAFKRLRAVTLTPSVDGLTIIGGNNRQGKTSCLDGIMSALGGERFAPTTPLRDGATKGKVEVRLTNGLTVTRSFTESGSYLRIAAGDGKAKSGGQALLNEFIASFALDIGSFLTTTDKEKAKLLLEVIGVDFQKIDDQYQKLYDKRTMVGQMRDRAKGHAQSMPYNEGVPEQLVTPTAVIEQMQSALTRNAKNRELRSKVGELERRVTTIEEKREQIEERMEALQRELDETNDSLARAKLDLTSAKTKATGLKDEDVSSMEAEIRSSDEVNAKVRENMERDKAMAEAEGYADEYRALTHQIDAILHDKAAILAKAKLPLAGLSVDAGILTYNSRPWDGMSHAEQLMVATAICRAINPAMGFVLIDKLESMDMPTLKTFGQWLVAEGIQAVATRVSQGPECDLIIEDGAVMETETKTETVPEEPDFG